MIRRQSLSRDFYVETPTVQSWRERTSWEEVVRPAWRSSKIFGIHISFFGDSWLKAAFHS